MSLLTEHIREYDFVKILFSFLLEISLMFELFREEEEQLPRFEQAISREESAKLARSFERTKMFAPTRYFNCFY